MPLTFRLHAALSPLFREGVVVRLVLATLHRSTQCLTLIFRDHIGKPVPLIFND
jgi:hypothetical protein